MFKLLFIGDIVGDQGLDLTLDLMPRMLRDYDVDFCVANGENIKNGKGITPQAIRRLAEAGVDVITSGNHIWDGRDDAGLLEKSDILLRPHNYPDINPGKGVITKNTDRNVSVTVINLQGRGFMTPIDCPFAALDNLLAVQGRNLQICLVDMHAESTAEKQALGWHADGRVTAVVGTHTHVQTADERILDKGTAYITDVGMTGSYSGVIGMDSATAIMRFRYQTKFYYKMARGDVRLSGLIIEINEKTYKATSIKRLHFTKADYHGR